MIASGKAKGPNRRKSKCARNEPKLARAAENERRKKAVREISTESRKLTPSLMNQGKHFTIRKLESQPKSPKLLPNHKTLKTMATRRFATGKPT